MIYCGAGDQTVNALTYGNLTTGVSGTKTLAGNVHVKGNLSVGAGTTLNLVDHTADRTGAGGTFSVANGATLAIGGFSNFPGLYSTATLGPTSTVRYNASGTAQMIDSSPAYGNLVVEFGGNKTLQAATTVNGNLSIDVGTTLDVTTSNHNIYLHGAWTNLGTFNGREGAVLFNGPLGPPASQGIYGTTTFYSLTLDNVSGLFLNDNNQTITGVLTFVNGIIETGANKIIIAPPSGSVLGADGTDMSMATCRSTLGLAPP